MLALKLGESLPSTGTESNIFSLNFNGTDEYVSVNSVVGDIAVATGTISVWTKVNTTSTSGSMVQARTDTDNLMNLFYHNGSSEGRFTYKAAGSAKVVAFTDSIENDGKWHNIVATWSVDADEIKIYLDGTLKGTTTGIGEWEGAVDACDIAQNTIDGAFFNGNLTEVAVFTRVVPIGELWIANRQPIDLTGSSGLVGYWKFDEGTGTVAADSSGTGNTGNLFNTPSWSTDVPYKTG